MSSGRGLFEVAVEKMRTRHFAYRTEKAYLSWIRRYVKFHKRRHPREMGAAEVESFLSHLAVDSHVSASTQNQALQALLFTLPAGIGNRSSLAGECDASSPPQTAAGCADGC